MLLSLQKYDVQIIYKKGIHLYLADTLSRAFLPRESVYYLSTPEKDVEEIDRMDYVSVSTSTSQKIKEAMIQDEQMQRKLKLSYITAI